MFFFFECAILEGDFAASKCLIAFSLREKDLNAYVTLKLVVRRIYIKGIYIMYNNEYLGEYKLRHMYIVKQSNSYDKCAMHSILGHTFFSLYTSHKMSTL